LFRAVTVFKIKTTTFQQDRWQLKPHFFKMESTVLHLVFGCVVFTLYDVPESTAVSTLLIFRSLARHHYCSCLSLRVWLPSSIHSALAATMPAVIDWLNSSAESAPQALELRMQEPCGHPT